ncbi:unnamed protein product [Musa textilis]
MMDGFCLDGIFSLFLSLFMKSICVFSGEVCFPVSTTCRGFTTLESQESAGVIPPELLTTTKTVLRPDRDIGQYADLVTRVTNFHGEDNGFMVLAGDVFDVPIRKDIIHRVVRWQLAKRQQGKHSTKTISEVGQVRNGTCMQRGTGRARHGTLHGPQVTKTFSICCIRLDANLSSIFVLSNRNNLIKCTLTV